MNEWYERAKSKLEAEKSSGRYDQYAQVMKDRVCETLEIFCQQDGEFAQAVVQGGAFADCMIAVAADAKTFGNGHGIPDLEAFRRAVRFYFPGADVKFHMTVNLCADVGDDVDLAAIDDIDSWAARKSAASAPRIIDLEDYL